MFCTSCGSSMNPDAQFCPSCGKPQGAAAASTPPPAYVPPTGVRSQTGRWIGMGWQMVKEDLGVWIVAALLYAVICGFVPVILQGPLNAGFMILAFKKMAGRSPQMADFFRGFNFFVPALVACLVSALIVMAGTLLCVIPGIVAAAALSFTYCFIVDKRMDFWPAMQASHAIVKQDYFGFTMFLIACALVNVLGALCCVVGLLVTVPLSHCAVAAAYQDIVGIHRDNPELA